MAFGEILAGVTMADGAPSAHPGWIRGDVVKPPAEVVPFLCDGAQHRARRALRLYKSADPWDLLDAAADAGGAVELLAKACVAAIEPALLAKGGNGLAPAETVLRLRGHGRALDPSRDPRLLTLDATAAVDIAERLHPKLSTVSAGARVALEARNDSLHMSIAVTDRVDAAVAGMAKYVREALPVLDLSPERFWGEADGVDAAGRAVDARTSRVTADADAKIEAAARSHERFLLRFSEDEARALAAGFIAKRRYTFDERPGYPERCPACENLGWADVEAGFDFEPDGEGGYNYFQTGQWVSEFECAVCHLQLTGEECQEVGIGVVEPDEDADGDR